MKTSERIRKLRLERGLTQKALGEACGIGESTIRKYELNLLNPKLETLEKIAKTLNVPYFDLVGLEVRENPQENDLLDSFSRLNETGKSKAIEAIKVLNLVDDYTK